jgi:hypothetical protein
MRLDRGDRRKYPRNITIAVADFIYYSKSGGNPLKDSERDNKREHHTGGVP